MKITFLGDSITAGVGASDYKNCFVDRVRQKLNCTVVNHGVSATRIARQQSFSDAIRDCDFNLREVLLPKDADYVFVFGGTNDFGHGDAPFGQTGDNTVNTFCGAVKCLIGSLVKDFGKNKVVVMLPLKRYRDETVNHATNKTLYDYVSVIKYFVKEFDVKSINLYDDGMPCTDIESSFEYFADGLHPNNKGHEFISDKIVEFIKNDK